MNINSRYLILGLVLVLSVIGYCFSVVFKSHEFNSFSFCFFVIISLYCMAGIGSMINLFYIFGLLFSLLSAFAIEYFGLYLSEVDQIGGLTGAVSRAVYLSSIFIVSLVFVYEKYRKYDNLCVLKITEISIYDFIPKLIFFACCIALCTLFTCLLIYGSPLIMGVDRFDYLTNYSPFIYALIFRNMPLLGLLVGFLVSRKIVKVKHGRIWVVFSIFVYVAGGEKFTGIYELLVYYLIPGMLAKRIVFDKKMALSLLVAVFFILSVVLLNYYFLYGDTAIFLIRLALQGQMIYALDVWAEKIKDFDVIYRGFFGLNVIDENGTGLAYLMQQVAPSSKVEAMLDNGATFTAPFPANILYYFGFYLAPILVALLGIISGFISLYFMSVLKYGGVFEAFFASKLFVLMYTSVLMGKTNLLFGYYFIVFFLVLFFLFLRYLMRIRHENFLFE